MNILTSMRERVDALAAWDELDVDASALPSCAIGLSDESVVDALAEVTALANHAGKTLPTPGDVSLPHHAHRAPLVSR